MATTNFRRDYLLRRIATPTSTARDSLGRLTTATVDYLGRPMVGTVFAATTAYTVGQYIQLAGFQVLKVTTAGTSGASAPSAPGHGNTVVNGTVTFTQVSNS